MKPQPTSKRILSRVLLSLSACVLLPLIVCAKDSRNDIMANLYSKRVSMVQLLANPEQFHGKKVFVDGYLHYVFEDDTLYFDREMADAGIRTNGLGLSFDDKNLTLIPMNNKKDEHVELAYFDRKWVSVYGTFDKDKILKDVSAVIENLKQPVSQPRSNQFTPARANTNPETLH